MNAARGHQPSRIYFAHNTVKFDFYKIVGADTVVLHVYEHFEIDYMENKTFLSFIQIISKSTSSTFTKISDCEVVLFLHHYSFGSVHS